jgi:hypothetical protein
MIIRKEDRTEKFRGETTECGLVMHDADVVLLIADVEMSI